MPTCCFAHRLLLLHTRRAARCCRPLSESSCSSMSGDLLRAEKQAARKLIKSRLKDMDEEQMAAESALIAAHVVVWNAFRAARAAGVYVHCARLREVDTTAVLQAALAQGTTRVYVPRVDDSASNMRLLHITSLADLRPVPPFGILEPPNEYGDDGAAGDTPRENALEAPRPLEVLVMPGLGFDLSGGRLGRGGGYYDKFVSAAEELAAAHGWQPPLLVALAYRAQLWRDGALPAGAHDRRVDVLATADGLRACSERARGLLGAPPPPS